MPRALRAVLFAVVAMIVGPPVGGMLFMGVLGVRSLLVYGPQSVGGFSQLWDTVLGTIAFSYLVGLLPAALASIPLAVVVGLHGRVSYRATAVAAIVASVLATALLFGRSASANLLDGLSFLAAIGSPSLAAALACRWVFGRLGLLEKATVPTASASRRPE